MECAYECKEPQIPKVVESDKTIVFYNLYLITLRIVHSSSDFILRHRATLAFYACVKSPRAFVGEFGGG